MKAVELRRSYVRYFEERGHKEIASASLYPDNDGRKENWWGPAGLTGPCGPDTEIFYDTGKKKCGITCGPSCHCGKYVEIWNNVFMEYNKNSDGSYTSLMQRYIDTGMGLERILMVLDQKNNVYETELFQPIIDKIASLFGIESIDNCIGELRIISDHMRASVFLLGDSKAIVPSNSEHGYILRRLIRRCIRLLKKLGVKENILTDIAETIIRQYQEVYPELKMNHDFILEQLDKEYELFTKTLDLGLKKAEAYFKSMRNVDMLSGELAFHLYDTFGFPIEFTKELALEYGIHVNIDGFNAKFLEHQEKSRIGAENKFNGGLADHSEQTTKLHTATHLLNGALRRVLGDNVYQRGSNITSERLRFDFSFDRKLTEKELIEIDGIVNEAIEKKIKVTCKDMTVEEAKTAGAIGVFDKRYGEIVKVYTIDGYSKEICGGPHIENTKELGKFRIIKEESSSVGVRRIKAVLE